MAATTSIETSMMKKPREVKAAGKQKSFQANLLGNLFFKHLQKAKSSLENDKD